MSSFKKLIASPDYDFRYGRGVNKPISRLQFSDKKKIIEGMCLHYSVLATWAELSSFAVACLYRNFICSVLRRVKIKEGACIDYIRCFIDVCLD